MAVVQRCDTTYRLHDKSQHATTRIEPSDDGTDRHVRAVIEDSPLHGTYGGQASTVQEALDFLNLAMQAEGAEEISFSCHLVEPDRLQ